MKQGHSYYICSNCWWGGILKDPVKLEDETWLSHNFRCHSCYSFSSLSKKKLDTVF